MSNAIQLPHAAPAAPLADAGGGRQRQTVNSLTTAQKAALIIAALGPESAGPIIERIEDKHLRAFARAYAHLQTVPKSALKTVVEEFVGRLSKDDNEIRGGFDETRELLGQFIGSDDIIRLMDDINVPGGQTVWEKLDRATDEALAAYLETQNSQLVAVVLSKINTEKASRVLDIIDDAIAEKVIIRLAKPMQIKREVLRVLSDTIERDFLMPLRDSSKGRNPGAMIGAMMNNVMSEKRDKLLAYITANAPDILGDVRKSMLTFPDLAARVPSNAISMVIKGIDTDVFLQAAKYGRRNAPESVEFIFKNISQRMAQQYEEQIEKLKTISVKDAEAAQAAFMTAVRKLVASGEIELIELSLDQEGDETPAEGEDKTEN